MKLRALLLACSALAPVLAVASCGSGPDESPCDAHADCSGDAPYCLAETGVCAEAPPGSEIGWGDGSEGAVELSVILDESALVSPVDLAFNPSKPEELWIINRTDDSVIILENPGTSSATGERRHDPAAAHFMDNPPALAMGAVDETWGQTFASCGDSDNGGDDFMGPALFTTRLDIYAEETPGGLGSHLDMLHSTTFCRGIAHIEKNVYFAFNSTFGSLDRYDFKEDHGPGNDDHSDGVILRYVEGALTAVDGVVSHLAYDPASKLLYVADTGTGRILALDTASGMMGSSFSGNEPVDRTEVDDAVLTEVVGEGVLTEPSGLEFHRGLIFVSDHATSKIHAFDPDGEEVRSLDTGLPAGSLAGFTFGPDGKLYLVDLGGRILRIDPIP